jgi:hypothetical protein
MSTNNTTDDEDETADLPGIARITQTDDGAYVVFTNAAAAGYRVKPYDDLPRVDLVVEEVVYMPGDFRDAVWEGHATEADPDEIYLCLVNLIDEYQYYRDRGLRDQLVEDWTVLGEVVTAPEP